MAFASIGGALPWQSGGANPFSDNPGASYASAYNSALSFNQANYNNILAGFNQTMASQQAQQLAIGKGYSQLEADVLGGITGTQTAAHQDILDQYYKARGEGQQQLINRGLGNTTIQQSVDRGFLADRSKQEVNLANQFAQMVAGYRSDLGKTRLGYLDKANMQNTGLANQQLSWMNSVEAAYPNAGDYLKASMMKGANKAGGANPFLGGGGGGISWDKKPTPPGGQMPNNAGWGGGGGYGYGGGGGFGGGNYGFGNSPSEVYPSSNAYSNWDIYGMGAMPFGDPSEYMTGRGGGDLPSPFPEDNWIAQQDAQLAGQSADEPSGWLMGPGGDWQVDPAYDY